MSKKTVQRLQPLAGINDKEKRIPIIPILLFVVLATVLSVIMYYSFIQEATFKTAIRDYQSGDYSDSIIIINRIIPTSEFKDQEKMLYYRCKAIRGLAKKLEKRYDDELKEIALKNRNSKYFIKNKSYLEKKLQVINSKIEGDLRITLAQKMSRIFPGGKFYLALKSQFQGSGYIQDLDYDQLLDSISLYPVKRVSAVISFFNKYPKTTYISELVKILFNQLEHGQVEVSTVSEQSLMSLIASYIARYPTSIELKRLFLCKGSNVNLRSEPTTESNVVGKIKKNRMLIQLGKTQKKYKIGTHNHHWYKVISFNGIKGWIYGKFLKQIDNQYLQKYKLDTWAFEDTFALWKDSNTPQNWSHISKSNKESITFRKNSNNHIVILQADENTSSGLFNRFPTGKAFTLITRARYIDGHTSLLAGYVLYSGLGYFIELHRNGVEICGKKYTLNTQSWHTYTLESRDGINASLIVDNKKIADNINMIRMKGYEQRGVYVLGSQPGIKSFAELDYIKIK